MDVFSVVDLFKTSIILTAIFANFLIGLVILVRNPRKILNLSLTLFAWVFAAWSVSLYFYDYPIFLTSLMWIRITYVIVVFGIVGSMYYFSYIFPTKKELPPIWGQISFFILASVLSWAFLATDLFVVSVTEGPRGPVTTLGPLYLLFILFDSFYGFWGLGLLIKKYWTYQGYVKAQLKYLFLGLISFVGVVLILDSLVPLVWGRTDFFSISTVGSLLFVGFTSYAIFRHRLLDIRIISSVFVVYVLLSLIASSINISTALIFWWVTGNPVRLSVIPFIVLVSVLFVLLFEPLKSLAKLIAERYLFQSIYDYQKTLKDLSLNLSSNLDLETLINNLVQRLTSIFKLKRIAFLIFDDQQNKYIVQKSQGFESNYMIEKLLTNQILDYLNKTSGILLLDEIRKLSDEVENNGLKNTFKEISGLMEQSQAALIIPFVSNYKIIGLVILGGKASLDPYTVQDVNFLNTVAYEVSTALQNAQSYEKIQRFNITLKERVDQATQELKAANDQLRQIDKVKDDFVSVTSHELRTPMTAIRSYAWMALHKADIKLSPKMEKYLVRVLISTERLINLVDDMLNISRIESGRIEIVPEPVDLIALCKDIVDEVYYSKSMERGMKFTILEQKIPKVFADPEKLRQVFLNLVGNAIKFTPLGGEITFSFFSDGQTVETSIKDNGIGISREDLSRLFKKFGRLDYSYTSTASSGGTGLGLYISKRLVELMHGKIWAYSEGVGKGATFTVAMPIASTKVLENAELYTYKPPGVVKSLEPVAI